MNPQIVDFMPTDFGEHYPMLQPTLFTQPLRCCKTAIQLSDAWPELLAIIKAHAYIFPLVYRFNLRGCLLRIQVFGTLWTASKGHWFPTGMKTVPARYDSWHDTIYPIFGGNDWVMLELGVYFECKYPFPTYVARCGFSYCSNRESWTGLICTVKWLSLQQ